MDANTQTRETLGATTGSFIARVHAAPQPAVLLKYLEPNDATVPQIARLQREYRLLQSLNIDGVIRPIASNVDANQPAISCHNVDGQLLETVMREYRFDLPLCLSIAIDLTRVVADLHSAGVVHKALQPANLLIDVNRAAVYVVDCSAAGDDQPFLPTSAGDSGWAYMAPEQTGRLSRPLDERADLYSLGIVLYRLFTGHLPFAATDPLEWTHCHIARLPRLPIELAPQLPATISAIVMRLLAKAPEDRYQSARGLRVDLARCRHQYQRSGNIAKFKLATCDIFRRLEVPRKLYGRETERTQLLQGFARMAASGTPALVLVEGAAGMGKSSLVDEIRQSVWQAHGHFITGKFEQYRRDIPYALLAQAFREFVQQVLSESENRIATWRQQLQEALGANGQLVLDIIPQLEVIIGPQPPVSMLPPLESQHRLHRVFRQLIGVVACHERPLLLFLDDMQWADAGSLLLFEHLLTHPQTRYVMLVGAFREPEAATARLLEQTLAKIGKTIKSQRIRLSPLSGQTLRQLLLDGLHCAPTDADGLAEQIEQKTHGNPFFAKQFLYSLEQEGLIELDASRSCWRWDIERIRQADVTDNVVELMTRQINRLPSSTQAALKVAACLGHQFALDRLAGIVQCAEIDLADELRPALQQQLLLTATHDSVADVATSVAYRWSHDRVQQAAYSLMSSPEQRQAHLRIGRFLMAHMSTNVTAECLFEIVGHLNDSVVLMTDPGERERLAELNFTAAQHAKRTAAYVAARRYADAGVTLLTERGWQNNYALTLALHREQIETAHLCRDSSDAEILLDRALAAVHSDIDRAGLLQLRLMFATAQRDHARAVSVGLDALRLLGVDLPADADGWAKAVGDTRARVDVVLAGVMFDDLLMRPLMSQSTQVAAADLLTYLMPAAHNADPRLFALLGVTLVDLSLTHGYTAASAFGYATFGALLAYEDLSRAYQFGKLAQRLTERFPQQHHFRAKVNIVTASFLDSWYEPISATITRLADDFVAEIDHGDVQYAGLNLIASFTLRLGGGESLAQMADDLAKAIVFTEQSANDHALHFLRQAQSLVVVLRDRSAATVTIDELLEQLGDRTDDDAKLQQRAQLQRLAIFGQFADALRLAQRPGASVIARQSAYQAVEVNFYHALAAAACYDSQDPPARQMTLTLLQTNTQKLARLADGCRANFIHLYWLLAAEQARITGAYEQALAGYGQAIAAARQYGFTHIQALAAECASRACAAVGADASARTYLQVASSAYAEWGADAKVEQLNLQASSSRSAPPVAVSAGSRQLDFLSVAKAAQAISSEIVLDKLLETLMHLVIENAGAQVGCLLLVHDDRLLPVVDAMVEQQTVQVYVHESDSVPVVRLPESILNYVRRSRENVILVDAAVPNPFSTDSYLIDTRPKSVLCLPIVRQAELVGVLYLENNLTANAFTPDRLIALELLSAQAAISIENARFYSELQCENEERQRAEQGLQQSIDEFVGLYESSRELAGQHDVAVLLDTILERTVALLRTSAAAVMLFDHRCNDLELVAVKGVPVALGTRVPMGQGLAGRVAQNRKPEIVNDYRNWEHRLPAYAFLGIQSLIQVPMLAGGELIGVLGVVEINSGRQYTDADQRLLSLFAAQAASAVRNASLLAETRRHAEQLAVSEQRFSRAFQASPAAMAIIRSNDGIIVDANASYLQLAGYGRTEVVGRTVVEIGMMGETQRRQIRGVLFEQKSVRDVEVSMRTKSGANRVLLTSVEKTEMDGQDCFLVLVVDITERKETEERMRHMAHHDALTGLPNRILMQDRIGQAIAQARRGRHQVAVLFIDLDYFKHINDSLGHQIGDRLLQTTAIRLQRGLREGDSVARLGGDEFVIILPALTDNHDVAVVAQKALESLDVPFVIDGNKLHVSGSIGISLYPTDGIDADALMRAADTAMYHAKEKGRGNYQFFTPVLNQAARRRLRMSTLLRQALAQREFELHYQPQVDIASGRILSVEALLRWRQPGHDAVSCGEFIAVAEDSGLILPIGEWTLREACNQLKCWHSAGRQDMRVAVNLSARQFYQPGFEDLVELVLQEVGLPATALDLEITERILMQPNEDNLAILRRISDMGVQLSVDDFGTGYSSLAYLQRFPINVLKIDRSFINGIGYDPNDMAIVSAIIALANNLNLSVIAEGVEKAEQATFLKEHGCFTAQGFYFGRPVSASTLTEMLRRQKQSSERLAGNGESA
ncbi:MAG: EAL domain-containing protein [Gammaproteobacteria bacterium]|nr:EAL domain-containing protein [Gammaproteobacteria bacterium]